MKTIAISIDEATLTDLDRVARASEKKTRPTTGSGRRQPAGNRSRIVRQALREFLQRRDSLRRDDKERRVYARHRRLIARQARALVGEQARP